MNPGDFGDPLTFPVVLPGNESFHSSSEMSQNLKHRLAHSLYRHSWFSEDESYRLWLLFLLRFPHSFLNEMSQQLWIGLP